MKKKTEDSCGNCRFWSASVDDIGDCRRHPPRLIDASIEKALQDKEWHEVIEALWDYTDWPETFDSQWCGEHERKR